MKTKIKMMTRAEKEGVREGERGRQREEKEKEKEKGEGEMRKRKRKRKEKEKGERRKEKGEGERRKEKEKEKEKGEGERRRRRRRRTRRRRRRRRRRQTWTPNTYALARTTFKIANGRLCRGPSRRFQGACRFQHPQKNLLNGKTLWSVFQDGSNETTKKKRMHVSWSITSNARNGPLWRARTPSISE